MAQTELCTQKHAKYAATLQEKKLKFKVKKSFKNQTFKVFWMIMNKWRWMNQKTSVHVCAQLICSWLCCFWCQRTFSDWGAQNSRHTHITLPRKQTTAICLRQWRLSKDRRSARADGKVARFFSLQCTYIVKPWAGKNPIDWLVYDRLMFASKLPPLLSFLFKYFANTFQRLSRNLLSWTGWVSVLCENHGESQRLLFISSPGSQSKEPICKITPALYRTSCCYLASQIRSPEWWRGLLTVLPREPLRVCRHAPK